MTLKLLHSHFFIYEENLIFFFISILSHEKGGRGRILESHFQGPPLTMALEMDGGGGEGGRQQYELYLLRTAHTPPPPPQS
jgi:hypothetical protein